MTGRRRARAGLVVLLVLLAMMVVGPRPAAADSSLSVSRVRQEPGLVEVHLTVRGLAAGQRVDPGSVTVQAAGAELAVRDTAQVTERSRDPRIRPRVAVLVLDVSGSMVGEPMAAAMSAAADYADELPADVEVAVVAVSTQARVALEPTADRDELGQVLTGLLAGGETALYDGLSLAAGLVGDRGDYSQRRVLVLSDGADTSSGASLPGVQQRLAAAEVPVDTVAFRTEESTTELLAELSTETGGRPEVAVDTEELAGAFRGAVGGFPLQLVVAAEVPAELAGIETRLEVGLEAGDEVLFASIPVVLAVELGAGPLSQAPARRLTPLIQGGLLGLVFLGLLALGLVTLAPLLDARRRRALSDRLEQFRAAPSPPPLPADSDESAVARAALALSERLVRARGLEDRMALRLDRAGMRLRPHEWLLLRALACLTGAILLMLLIHPLFAVPLGALAGWVGSWLYQRIRVDRRRQAFAGLLPDALQLVIGSLRSGFSLPQAIDAMARELPDPISSEFGRALGETRLGERLDVALDRVAIRMQSPDLTWAVVAIRVQQQVGGNLAEVLSTTVKTIRERESLRRHVRALSAEGRLSAWILVALPIVMGVFMFSFRPEYMRPLVTQPLGLLMLLAGVVLIVVGGFWMSRLVKIEV